VTLTAARERRPSLAGAPWTTVAVDRRGGRTVADLRRGALGPYALGDDGGTLRVALVATGARLLGGDHVRLRVRVGAGAALELVETSGTVAYDGRGRSARWEVDVVVEDGGVLLWDAQPFVVCTGADVHRTTSVRLGAGATACLRETVVLGRSGERGGRLRTAMRVDGPGGAVLVEELLLDGARPEPGVLGEHRVVDSVVLLGRRPDDDALPTVGRATVLRLEEPGAVARRTGREVHRVSLTGTAAAWRAQALAAGEARVAGLEAAGASARSDPAGAQTVVSHR
jgi:urease accessory protein